MRRVYKGPGVVKRERVKKKELISIRKEKISKIWRVKQLELTALGPIEHLHAL